MKKLLALSAILFCLLVGNAEAWRKGSPTATFTMQSLKIGAGGITNTLDIQCDQGVGNCSASGTTTKVVRTDTYGAYVYNSALANPGNAGGTGVWQQLVTSSSIPSLPANGTWLPDNGNAVYEIRVCPANTNVLAMMFNGNLYTSTNKGSSWTKSTLTQSATSGADQYTEAFAYYMAFDPANCNTIVTGTAGGHAFYTLNQGTSWTQITGLCAAPTTPSGATQGGGYLVAFDPSSTVTGGNTQGVFISCYGDKLYHSTTGANGTFSAVVGSPTTFTKLKIDNSGNVYVVDDAGTFGQGALNKRIPAGTWSVITTGLGAAAVRDFAFDPDASGKAFATDNFGQTTFFNGTSWSAVQGVPIPKTATDIPWLANDVDNAGTFDLLSLTYDPAQSHVVYGGQGTGVWTTTPSASVTWTSINSGIEQMVSRWVASPPGGNPAVTFSDRAVFMVTDKTKYPTQHGTKYTISAVSNGWGVDYATNNPSYLFTFANYPNETTAFSSNGGGTDGAPSNWTQVNTSSITEWVVNGGWSAGGGVAALSSTSVVVAEGNGAGAGTASASGLWVWNGTSWSSPTVSGISGCGNPGWDDHYVQLNRHIIAADRGAASTTYYAYNQGTSCATAGIYKSTNSGTSWTRVFTGVFDTSAESFFNATLKAVPGVAGDVWFTSGPQAPEDTAQVFHRSTDGGVTWNAVPNVSGVSAFGFGKAKPGDSYPAVYVFGYVSGTLGLWRGTNMLGSPLWEKIASNFPNGSIDQVLVVEGDNNTYGTVYVCFFGSSCAYGHL